jgi:hypothetical protein
MPFARIDLAQGRTAEYRATLADVVYKGIVGVLKARRMATASWSSVSMPENFVFDPNFLDIKRSPDLIYIQVTSTVGSACAVRTSSSAWSSSTARTGPLVMANRGD